jgi:hypothetical protein
MDRREATESWFKRASTDLDTADMLSVLTEYAVHIRYPSEIEISNEDMRRALANAKSIEALTLSLAEATQ